MKYALGVLLALILIGGLVWFYLGTEPAPASQQAAVTTSGDVSFKVIGEGASAIHEPVRKNYAIYNQATFSDFWKETHDGSERDMPIIDFSEHYVIGVFAGSVPSDKHEIEVTKIRDMDGTRSVSVLITQPGDRCVIIEEPTFPYQFVEVPFSDAATFTHTDTTQARACGN